MAVLSVRNIKAFTLVEILVVMGIMAGLFGAFIMMVNPAGQIKKARDADRKSDLSIISTALEQYYADYNSYPPDSGTGSDQGKSGIECLEQALSAGDALCDGSSGADKYIKTMPHDPQTDEGAKYCYSSQNNGQDYVLCARFEYQEGDIPTGITSCGPTGVGTGSGDYCITNPF